MVNIIGNKYGRLTVLSDTGKRNKFGDIYYLCECGCDAHTKVEVLGSNLRRGLAKSCGCINKERLAARARDITGQKFGYLTAICPTDIRKGSFVVWKCHCDYCGRDAYIPLNRLTCGQISCGKCRCAADKTRERMTKWKDPIEVALGRRFSGMVSRCYNKNSDDYPDYGGRGIYICKEWTDDRTKFVEWGKLTGYQPGLSLERIDNDGPYAPWNCKWVTNRHQQSNKRSNHLVTVSGITATITQWAYVINKKPSTLYHLASASEDDLNEYITYAFSKMSASEKSIADRKMQLLNMEFNRNQGGIYAIQ